MNKKVLIVILVLLVVIGLILGRYFLFNKNEHNSQANQYSSETGSNEKNNIQNNSEKRTATNSLREGEFIQTQDKNKATRVVNGGTKIKMTFGDTIIYGVLNDSETAKALIQKLPITQHESRYTHDFCGVTEKLPYNEDEVHYGWLNGDIDYAIDAPYYTILFKDEEISEQYGDQVNIGVITSPISEIDKLSGSFDVKIELDN